MCDPGKLEMSFFSLCNVLYQRFHCVIRDAHGVWKCCGIVSVVWGKLSPCRELTGLCVASYLSVCCPTVDIIIIRVL